MTMTTALERLEEMTMELRRQKEDDKVLTPLGYWRVVANADIAAALHDFGANEEKADNEDEAMLSKALQALFTRLNEFMWQQEQDLLWPCSNNNDTTTPPTTTTRENQVNVVFGGKWSPQPISIAETLVAMLANNNNNNNKDDKKYPVTTVSRSTMPNTATLQKNNIAHYTYQNLDQPGGDTEFAQVMQQALQQVTTTAAADDDDDDDNNNTTTVTFYFTLGQHTGPNHPVQRNLQGAQNFAKALTETVDKLLPRKMTTKVVLTGTDATKPSTHPDDVITVNGIATVIPTYKIMKYNFVYAASKLGQFFIIAQAIAALTHSCIPPLSNNRHDGSLSAIIQQLQSYVVACGDDGTYYDNNGFITDKELDAIAVYWRTVVLPALHPHLIVADNISICFTPLHLHPWVKQAMQLMQQEQQQQQQSSKRAFLLEQVVRRFKNAISIRRAAAAHLQE